MPIKALCNWALSEGSASCAQQAIYQQPVSGGPCELTLPAVGEVSPAARPLGRPAREASAGSLHQETQLPRPRSRSLAAPRA